jgi:acetate kinase
MRILVFNCGSATVKFRLFRAEGEAGPGGKQGAPRLVEAAGGKVASEDGEPRLEAALREGGLSRLAVPAEGGSLPAIGAAVEAILSWLEREGGAGLRPEAVGHRVVHGGESFREPLLIDGGKLSALETLSSLAPLHNPQSVSGVRAALRILGPAVANVAVFDTGFHATIPPEAATYAIPRQLARRHSIRRYGFHGIAHRYLAERYAEMSGLAREEVDLVTLHLGGGSSACAIKGGRSADTSMGMTPLEGLMMGTRSGDLDPAIVALLSREEGVEAGEVERWLNQDSGLLGVSGKSSDMREVLAAAAKGDPDSQLAFRMFVHRAKKYLGAYLALLGGARAVIFSGGIGEHAPEVRQTVCEGMEWCGLRLDPGLNREVVGREGRISREDSAIAVWVIPVEEELVIARETLRLLSRSSAVPATAHGKE